MLIKHLLHSLLDSFVTESFTRVIVPGCIVLTRGFLVLKRTLNMQLNHNHGIKKRNYHICLFKNLNILDRISSLLKKFHRLEYSSSRHRSSFSNFKLSELPNFLVFLRTFKRFVELIREDLSQFKAFELFLTVSIGSILYLLVKKNS